MKFPVVLFDWADTIMVDTDPTSPLPMCEWADLRLVPGAARCLAHVSASGRRIALATSAQVSTEAQIRTALARVGVSDWFSAVFCQRNTGLPKGVPFYLAVVSSLGEEIDSSDVLMIGDSLSKDVEPALAAGLGAVWFNEGHRQKQGSSPSCPEVGSMDELISWFSALDQQQM